MAPHIIAEQDEIVLVNLLKSLFNSVRSNSLHVINDVHASADASFVFVLERISLCEKSVAMLKNINNAVKKTVLHCLKNFRDYITEVSARTWMRVFEETVVQPFERVLLKIHPTKEGKTWVKTCLAIFRK